MGSGGAEEALGGVGEGVASRPGWAGPRHRESECPPRAAYRPGRREAGELPDRPGGQGCAPWWGWRPGLGVDMGAGFGGPGGPGDPLNVVGFQEAARVVSGSVFLERTSQKE